jgi:energy-coupling factor transporter ATP-binding protein EcfA2
MSTAAPVMRTNPFATRHVKPGAIPYLFAEGDSLERMIARFEANDCRGQIVGPHGSGKSTLLATLSPALETRGYELVMFQLRSGQRALPTRLAATRSKRERQADKRARRIIIVDGYEQLSRWHGWRLRRHCVRRKLGLLVTTHRACRLPLVVEMRPTLATAQKLFSRLLSEGDNLLTSSDVATMFARHDGNLRETLFGLYDLYELRRR